MRECKQLSYTQACKKEVIRKQISIKKYVVWHKMVYLIMGVIYSKHAFISRVVCRRKAILRFNVPVQRYSSRTLNHTGAIYLVVMMRMVMRAGKTDSRRCSSSCVPYPRIHFCQSERCWRRSRGQPTALLFLFADLFRGCSWLEFALLCYHKSSIKFG